MRKNKIFQDNCEYVFTYLDYRNSFYMGYVPYTIYKKRIAFITGLHDGTLIRRIFNWLLVNKYVKKSRRLGRVVYLFNPHKLEEEILKPNGFVDFL